MTETIFPGPVPVLSELLLISVCILADHYDIFSGHSGWAAAIRDNGVHGTIACFCWAVFCDWRETARDLIQCVVCGLLAMVLDVDHFIAAKTFTLKGAVSHPTRPPLHATSVIPLCASFIYVTSRLLSWKSGTTLAVMLTIAWLSHHIRDGVRRGLWLPPFGSTPPIPFNVYVASTAILPVLFKVMKFYSESFSNISKTVTSEAQHVEISDV
ncbi:transmembrane protein 267-like [Liolophura sinensis]|uniref:transmembrane protein 267-like n=1 Tax=Liolophura sinensis TaxID=3198878 RepID=UPI0031595877